MTTSTTQPPLADLIARYGSSSSTTWLEHERYRLWRPSEPVPESSFVPVQGYMEKEPYIFAWGDPLVSSPAALPSVARQFIAFAREQGKRPVWLCINRELADVLGETIGWCAVSCVHEDELDPAHVMAMTSPLAKGKEGQKLVKDLKKNLARAEKAGVDISEVAANEWTEQERLQVDRGIKEWRAGKHGIQIASTSMQPWLDFEHRRYWVAKAGGQIAGILILTPIQGGSWQIKNAVSFPSAPKGTSETLIYTMLKDVNDANGYTPTIRKAGFVSPPLSSSSSNTGGSDSEGDKRVSMLSTTSSRSSQSGSDGGRDPETIHAQSPSPIHDAAGQSKGIVTFGSSAAPHLKALHNLSGWKVNALMNTYSKIVGATGILRRGEFRNKFDSHHTPMYVCYPPEGFGLDGAKALLKVLKK